MVTGKFKWNKLSSGETHFSQVDVEIDTPGKKKKKLLKIAAKVKLYKPRYSWPLDDVRGTL